VDNLQGYRDEVFAAAEIWFDSHDSGAATPETTLARGYLYDCMKRYAKAKAKLDADTVAALKAVVAEKKEGSCQS